MCFMSYEKPPPTPYIKTQEWVVIEYGWTMDQVRKVWGNPYKVTVAQTTEGKKVYWYNDYRMPSHSPIPMPIDPQLEHIFLNGKKIRW